MVTELYISSDTVEPETTDKSAHREPFNLREHMETCPAGRLIMKSSQWLVVLGLIFVGYFAAGAINSGIESAFRSDRSPQHLVATSSSHK